MCPVTSVGLAERLGGCVDLEPSETTAFPTTEKTAAKTAA